MASSSICWLSAKIMSNGIPMSGLKQRDGHVPSTRTVLAAILSVRLGLWESMKNPRLNGDNRVTPDRSLHRRRTEDFYSSERGVVSQDDILFSNRRKSERKKGRVRALFSRFMKSMGEDGIQFGGEFALDSPALAWHSTAIRVHALCWNVKWAGARREINLNPRTRELPALTRASATHPFYCVCFTGNLM